MAKALRKAQKRLDSRRKDFDNQKGPRKHVHHRPGSMKKVH